MNLSHRKPHEVWKSPVIKMSCQMGGSRTIQSSSRQAKCDFKALAACIVPTKFISPLLFKILSQHKRSNYSLPSIDMKSLLSFLALLCMMALPSSTATPVEGGELMVRYLMNEGEENGHFVCSNAEVDLIRNTLIDLVDGIDRRALRTSRQLINCPKACCGYDYGTCGVLNRRCRNYPTYTSNKEECNDRRELSSEDNKNEEFIVLEDIWYGDDAGSDGRLLQGADWLSTCLAEKRATMVALMGIVDGLSDACESFALSPTLMNCLFVPEVTP